MEECSVLIETTKSAENKTSRWFDLPIDYELFRDLLGVEADSGDYQITDMKLPFAGDIVRTTSVRRLNKLYFAYTDLSPEVQQAYKELIPYCGGVEDLLQESEEFLFYPECHNIMDVARYRLEPRNLWIIKDHVPHIDPEANFFGPSQIGGGVEFNSIPSTRSFGFNLRLTL